MKDRAYHHGDLRGALMRAALELIDRHGVKGFTLKDAAKMAGVSIAAPYRHFADKDALIVALAGEGFSLFDGVLSMAYERGFDAREKIVELGVAYVKFALANTAYFRVMFGGIGTVDPGENPESMPEGTTGFLLLLQSVGELLPEAAPEVRKDMLLACWSVVHGFALLELDGAFEHTVGPIDAEIQLRRTLAVVIGENTAANKRWLAN